nr:hypothetical protein [Tanacetum cinerariifolium]
MWYFPIIPRLQGLFNLESISEELRWHAIRRITDGVLRHPADSQAWRTIDEKFLEIAKDLSNLRLGISADGVDVNSGTRHQSVWPVLSVVYNLPPWLCIKRKFIMLSVLISGYPRNDIDVFLEPLVDDLHTLFETGVDTYDASRKENFNLWKVDNKTHKVYENIPGKVMWYFPIIPRLQGLFNLESISEELRWHAIRRITDGVLRHPADSQAWRTIDEKFLEIAKDLSNLRLGISADGVDVNSGTRHQSVWPVLSVVYNLPPWLCIKRKFIMLSVLISGYPRNDIDVFLEPLVDDLHTLFETGVDTYDASRKENFNLYVVVLWTINDYPALGTLCGCPYSGFKGCVVCWKDTHCVRLSTLSKQSYVGHRRYLPYNHPFRRQKKAFNGQQEFQLALNLLTEEQIYNEVQQIKNKWGKGKRTNNKTSENQENTKGRGGKIQKQKKKTTEEEGRSSQKIMLGENLVGTLLNVLGKIKDRMNARLDLAELGIKPELFPRQEEDKTTLPPAGYTLTNAEKDILCETLCNIKGCIAEETIAEETIVFFSEYHKTMKTIGIPPDKHVTNENDDGKPLSASKSSEVSREVFQIAHLTYLSFCFAANTLVKDFNLSINCLLHVGIKSLLDAVRVTVAHICVNAAQL